MNLDSLGTVYGTLLNFRSEWEAWAPKMKEAPYKAPPEQPVLYIKPANTWSNDGTTSAVPARAPHPNAARLDRPGGALRPPPKGRGHHRPDDRWRRDATGPIIELCHPTKTSLAPR